ncbi:MAG TPA: alpha/beta fold hydrolase [Terracidiphilus sp.]|jgi:pimeloyl-ACP methyl ester carboxylesterase|nr:alpha/beta fold hydrolase [Terracidiphilus sp.]
MKVCLYGIAMACIAMLTGCGGVAPNLYGKLLSAPTVVGTDTTTDLDHLTEQNDLVGLPGVARCNVTVAQIVYTTSGVQPGERTDASAAVLIPSGPNCPGPYPLIAFGRATVTEKLQANADLTNPTTQLIMTFFAAQGYAVVATDFLGYARSSYAYHPYTHAPTEASSIIDSIRAAREAAPALGLKLNGKIMVSGYSQGGQAAMATQRAIEQASTAEFDVVAAAHLAGPYNISGALVGGAKNPINGVQSIVPFQIASYQKIYGNMYAAPSDVFQPAYAGFIADLFPTLLPTATVNALLPGGTPAQAQAAMFQAAFIADLANNPNNAAVLDGAMQNTLDWNPIAPTTLCGGSGDPTVNFAINAQTAYSGFIGRGLTNVSIHDVDADIQGKYGSVLDPMTYNLEYHGMLEPPFCMQVAQQFFNQYR